MTTLDADFTPLFLHHPRPAPLMVRGAGSWLWDDQNRPYLDFTQGWAVNCLGHAPPLLQQALCDQAQRLFNPGPAFFNAPQLELARGLIDASGLGQVFLCSTGAEANEGAVKLARAWGRRHLRGAAQVITTVGGFHGRTLAMTAASGKPGWEALFAPMMPGFVKVPYGDADAVARAIDQQTAAVMVEPIQGEGGVNVPPDGYLRELRALTRERGILFILDEIQTGMGRTGTLFAHERDQVKPDLLTLGKGLGGGFPLAAVLTSREANCLAPGEQGGTYAGNALAAAVGAAVLRTLREPGFLVAVRARAEELELRLRRAAARFGGRVRGRGLLQALVLPGPWADRVVIEARSVGLLVNAARPDVVRLSPALNVTADEIDLAVGRLEVALENALPAPASPV